MLLALVPRIDAKNVNALAGGDLESWEHPNAGAFGRSAKSGYATDIIVICDRENGYAKFDGLLDNAPCVRISIADHLLSSVLAIGVRIHLQGATPERRASRQIWV